MLCVCACHLCCTWYHTWLLIKLIPKGVVFSFTCAMCLCILVVLCIFALACIHACCASEYRLLQLLCFRLQVTAVAVPQAVGNSSCFDPLLMPLFIVCAICCEMQACMHPHCRDVRTNALKCKAGRQTAKPQHTRPFATSDICNRSKSMQINSHALEETSRS